MRKEGPVDVGREGGRLAAQREVGRAEVGHDGHAQADGQLGRAPDLERRPGRGPAARLRHRHVLDGLAVRPDQVEGVGVEPGSGQGVLDGLGKPDAQAGVELADEADVRRRGLDARGERLGQGRRVGLAHEPQRLDLDVGSGPLQPDHGRVDTVERGPAHEARDDARARGHEPVERAHSPRWRISAARSSSSLAWSGWRAASFS